MGLLVCIACKRQRILNPLQRVNYYCSNCHAHFPRKIYRRKVWMDWTDKSGKIQIEAQSGTYAGLLWVVENKKYKIGWAAIKFKIIFGYWPPPSIENISPDLPSPLLLRFIASQNEIWKKHKRAEELDQVKKKAPELCLAPSSDPRITGTYNPPWMTEDDWAVKL